MFSPTDSSVDKLEDAVALFANRAFKIKDTIYWLKGCIFEDVFGTDLRASLRARACFILSCWTAFRLAQHPQDFFLTASEFAVPFVVTGSVWKVLPVSRFFEDVPVV